MPNWCNNTVIFSGKNADKANQIFKELCKTQKKNLGQGVTFELVKNIEKMDRNPYMFAICKNKTSNNKTRWNYETKWVPNTKDLKLVADKVGCDFTHYYDEIGMLIYGCTKYINKKKKEIYLKNKDFNSYSYSDENDLYIFEDKAYESEYDILEILLKRKMKSQS